jgi:hypothetical protein
MNGEFLGNQAGILGGSPMLFGAWLEESFNE